MGRVKQLEIAQAGALATLPVVPGDAHFVIQRHGTVHLALAVDTLEPGQVLIIRGDGLAGGHIVHHASAQLVAHLTGSHQHFPGLDIAVGRCQLGQ
jgi:alpha-D-ribose 1-methylphosphonate 5-triphosphate synthase subunit PhnH